MRGLQDGSLNAGWGSELQAWVVEPNAKYVELEIIRIKIIQGPQWVINLTEEPAPGGELVQRKMKPKDIWQLPRDHVFQFESLSSNKYV